jgi:flagellar protein FliL
MADAPKPVAEVAPSSPAAAGDGAPKSGPPIVMIGIIAGALVLGGAGGAFLVGPRIVAARNAAKPAAHAKAGDQAAADAEKPGKQGAGDKHGLYRIENLIVNPAGSQGTRFLMATVAFEVADEKMAATLKERDVQLRDAVISALEGDTLDELTHPGGRDSVKAQVARAVKPLTSDVRGLRIYLPQFVIQ